MFFVLFIYLLLGTVENVRTALPQNIFFTVDPLTGVASLLASRSLIVPLVIGAAAFLLVALIFGRVWCGWVCPMGTLNDLVSTRSSKKLDNDPTPWWFYKYAVLFTVVLIAAFGSMTLIGLDPLTLLYRSLTSAVFPLISGFLALVEMVLGVVFPITSVHGSLAWFDTNVRQHFLGTTIFYLPNLVLLFVFAAVLAFNFVRPRAWCRYLCPLGAFGALVSKVSLVKHRVNVDKCTACDRCVAVCPTGAVRKKLNYAADRSECIACLDCIANCPDGAISFPAGVNYRPSLEPERRQFIAMFGLAVIGAFLLRFPSSNKKLPALLRPPGTAEYVMETKCIRCGECARVCPTHAIQTVNSFQAWDTAGSPYLILRQGYCDYSCNACGQVCPTGAIPKLTLAEKQVQNIGIAVVDEQRCVAFVENRECLICRKVCPLPQKAIMAVNQTGSVARPKVDTSLCTGCGVCEYNCPVKDDAAIRVYRTLAVSPETKPLVY